MKSVSLSDPLSVLGWSDAKIAGLKKLQLETVGQLVFFQPRKYEDYSKIKPIRDLALGQVVIKAQILEAKGRYLGYRGLHLTEALAQDESGSVRIIWFNQPYRARGLKVGQWYYIYGLYDLKYKHLQIINPSAYLVDSNQSTEEGDFIRPIYRANKDIKSASIWQAIKRIWPRIEDIPEILPAWLQQEADLSDLGQTLNHLHFPTSSEMAEEAMREMAFRELIAISLSSQLLRRKLSTQTATTMPHHRQSISRAIARLPFKLTGEQQEIVFSILKEMEQLSQPLNRLVQGDVGSGKTLIALLVALNVILNGYQVAILTPTHILSQQHYQTSLAMLKDFLPADQVAVLLANSPAQKRRHLEAKLATGEIKLVIGSQVLLGSKLKFKNLALTIIDEQHRFGVDQRLKLLGKTESSLSHVLTLSATPIPRSLALVLYADLDISLLKERPPGRQEVKTKFVPLKERVAVLQNVLRTSSKENRIYIVCPVIEDGQSPDSLKETESFLPKLDPKIKLAVLHGKMKAEEKEKIILKFQSGQLDVLLSTSVIGAGIDIGCANTIVILSPERFGLAQLHQFRGRVGRRQIGGQCYLCPQSNDKPSVRLQALLDYQSGFALSELDLKLRGPGTLFGVKQTGLPHSVNSSWSDIDLITRAAALAAKFIDKENLDQFPDLKREVGKYQQITHLN